MQCVAVNDKVWIVSSWVGGFPKQANAPFMYVYDPINDTWETKPPMPSDRRRGSTAVIVVNELLYVAFGNTGGHEQDDFATSYNWLDVYNTITGEWKVLPSGTYVRDHTGGGLVNENLICVGGGRDGGSKFWPNVAPTECYDLRTNTWSIGPNVFVKRAGSAYGTSCDGKLLMAGGEGGGQTWKNFEVFDGTAWTKLADLNIARHGTGLAVDCVCNQIYIASGNGAQGGGSELYSVETFSLDHSKPCLS
jgi:Galactose oxidase, central domain